MYTKRTPRGGELPTYRGEAVAEEEE